MREISAQQITEVVKKLCIEANCHLPRDVKSCIEQCHAAEQWDTAREILERIKAAKRLRSQLNGDGSTR